MADTRIHDALALLRRKGWGPSGGCMITALSDVTPHLVRSTLSDDVTALSEVCASEFPERGGNGGRFDRIWMTNDHPDTTFEDVERIMEKAYVNRCSEL